MCHIEAAVCSSLADELDTRVAAPMPIVDFSNEPNIGEQMGQQSPREHCESREAHVSKEVWSSRSDCDSRRISVAWICYVIVLPSGQLHLLALRTFSTTDDKNNSVLKSIHSYLVTTPKFPSSFHGQMMCHS